MKRVLGIVLSMALIFGMILPNINADATEAKTVEKVEAKYNGVIVEGMKPDQIDDSKVEYICTFSDGDKESFYKHETVLGDYVAPTLTPKDVPSDGTWKAGKNYYTGQLCGKDFQLEVDVISKADSPIKSISAVPTMDLVPEWHTGGLGAVPFLMVEYCNPKVTITYLDGSQETVGYMALKSKFKGVEPSLILDDSSAQGIGKRTATLDFYGRTCSFSVNVVENPVDYISAVTTKPLVKGFRGNAYLLAYDGGLIVTAHFKDGKTVSGGVYEMLAKFNDFPTDYWEDENTSAVVGKNMKKLRFLGKTCDVAFEVIEDTNPVVGMDAKVKDNAVIYQNTSMNGRTWYNYEQLVEVELTYKNGSKLTGTIDEVNEELEKIGVTQVLTQDTQRENEWTLGMHSTTVSYMEFEKEVELKVVENPYAKATISNENGLTIVLEKKSGAKETYTASKFIPTGSSGNSHNMLGYLQTDKESLAVELKCAGGRNPDYTDISYMVVNGVKSNKLEACEWMEQQIITEMYGDVPNVTVNNSAAELKEMVLTDEDYYLGNESEVKVWLAISEKDGETTAEEKELLNKAADKLGNYDTGLVLDFTLCKQSGDEIEKVSEPNGKVSITMAVPEEVLASGTDPSTIKMVRIHNGKTEVLPCKYDAATKTITFETDAFSTYSLVYQGTGSGTGVQQPSPNTGDNATLIGYMALCVAMMVVILMEKRRNALEK